MTDREPLARCEERREGVWGYAPWKKSEILHASLYCIALVWHRLSNLWRKQNDTPSPVFYLG